MGFCILYFFFLPWEPDNYKRKEFYNPLISDVFYRFNALEHGRSEA